MPCPYFQPTERLDVSCWERAPRAPLGELHAGTCAISNSVPDEATLRSYCNMGYAGRGCSNFPSTAECDAIRYSLASDCDGMLRIQFIHEKDHNPLSHGVTIYDTAAGTLTNLDGCAAIQARAFARGYLRRRARA